jgi:hypothetical protein
MRDYRFYNLHDWEPAGLDRVTVPLLRLLRRLLRPVFGRQVEIFQQLGHELEQVRADLNQLRFGIIEDYLDQHENVHLAIGGLGDAWLTIAACYQQKVHVLFGTNRRIESLIARAFRLFDVPVRIVPNFHDDTPEGYALYRYVQTHPHLKNIGYLPPTGLYADWAADPERYFQKVVTRFPTLAKLGKTANLRPTARMIALAPCGSDQKSPEARQRLNVADYHQLVAGLLAQHWTVLTCGSEQDLKYYGLHPHAHHIWLHSDWMVSHPGPRVPSDFRSMLQILNGCDEVISVDTWLKTYSGLAGIPTRVIVTESSLEPRCPGDYIFLNPGWGFQMLTVPKLLQSVGALTA